MYYNSCYCCQHYHEDFLRIISYNNTLCRFTRSNILLLRKITWLNMFYLPSNTISIRSSVTFPHASALAHVYSCVCLVPYSADSPISHTSLHLGVRPNYGYFDFVIIIISVKTIIISISSSSSSSNSNSNSNSIIILHYIILYHIISYHITLHYITSYHIISYYIILYIFYSILFYSIILYYIILYYIILYHHYYLVVVFIIIIHIY